MLVGRFLSSIKENKNNFIITLVLVALAFIPFWRMGLNGLWEIYDQGFPVYPIQKFTQTLYLWNDFAWGTGFPIGFVTSISLPGTSFIAALACLGVPANLIQRFWLILWTMLTGLSMYYFMNTILYSENEVYKRVASIFASVLYMFNPFALYWLFLGAYPLFSLTVLPFMLALLVRGFRACERNQRGVKYVIGIAFLSIFTVGHPEAAVIVFSFVLFFCLYQILKELFFYRFRLAAKKIVFLAFSLILALFLNSYWLLPNIYANIYSNLLQNMLTLSQPVVRVRNFFTWPFPLLGAFSLRVATPTADMLIVGIILFILIALPLLLRPRDKRILFFTLSLLIYTGFKSGVFPFNILYIWLYGHFILFSILVDPHKFGYITLLCSSFLLGISVAEIYKRLKQQVTYLKPLSPSFKIFRKTAKHFPLIAMILISTIILFNINPLLTGNFRGFLTPINVPNYYSEAGDWLKMQNGNFRIVIVPMNLPGWSPSYTWLPDTRETGSSYSVAASATWALGISPVPSIDYSGWSSAAQILSYISANETTHLGKIVSLWNVRYLIITNDMVYPWTGERISTESFEKFFQHQEDLQFAKRFGELDVYENMAWKDSLVYGSSTYLLIPTQSQWSVYEALCNIPNFNPVDAVLFSSSNMPDISEVRNNTVNISNYISVSEGHVTFTSAPLITKNNIIINYEKINPAKYIVHVDAERPFILVLSSTYDSMWSAKLEGENSPLEHFQVNFYANGWHINKTGKLNITLENEPQSYLEIGTMVSAGATIMCLIYLSIPTSKKLWKASRKAISQIKGKK